MKLQGQGVSPGVAAGPVLIWRSATLVVPFQALAQEQVEAELARLHHALGATRAELLALADTLRRDASAEVAAIFEAHVEMLDDPELIGEVSDQIRSQLINASTHYRRQWAATQPRCATWATTICANARLIRGCGPAHPAASARRSGCAAARRTG